MKCMSEFPGRSRPLFTAPQNMSRMFDADNMWPRQSQSGVFCENLLPGGESQSAGVDRQFGNWASKSHGFVPARPPTSHTYRPLKVLPQQLQAFNSNQVRQSTNVRYARRRSAPRRRYRRRRVEGGVHLFYHPGQRRLRRESSRRLLLRCRLRLPWRLSLRRRAPGPRAFEGRSLCACAAA